MPDRLPCPLCKNPIATAAADARGRVQCELCLHEFLLRGQRLAPLIDDLPVPSYPEPPADDPPPVRSRPSPSNPPPRAERLSRSIVGPASRRPLFIVLGVIVAVVIGVIGAYWLHSATRRHDPWVRDVDFAPEERFEFAVDDLNDPTPVDVAELRRGAEVVLARLGPALLARNRAAINGCLDAARTYDEFRSVAATRFGTRRDHLRRVAATLVDSLDQHGPTWGFDQFEILAVEKIGHNDGTVTMRHKFANGAVGRIRWWVSKRSGSWRVYDAEDLGGQLRWLLMCAELAVGELTLDHQDLMVRVDELQLALGALPLNAEKAEGHLERVGDARMPDRFEACRQLAIGQVLLFRKNKSKEALEPFARARAIDPKPQIDYVEAFARNNLGDHARALELLDDYARRLGDDSAICQERSMAYRGLNRPAEALAQTRRALDFVPNDFQTFQTLLRSLGPDDSRDDVGRRFAQLGNSAIQFRTLAKDRLDFLDWRSLDALAQEMTRIEPESADPKFCLALCRLQDNKPREAAELVKAGLARDTDSAYRDLFVQGAIRAGKTNEAYAATPEPRKAFALLGSELYKTYRLAELRRLIARHVKAEPADPALAVFRGRLAAEDGDYEAAVKFFAEARGKADAELFEQARPQRTLALYHLGKALTAYDEARHKDDAFVQLANLAWFDRNQALLGQIVDRQTEFNDQHDYLPRCRLRLKLLAKKEAEAGKLLRALKVRDQPFPDNSAVFDCIDAGLPMVAYQHSHDRRAAFEAIARDSLGSGQRTKLAELIEVHRKNDAGDPSILYFQGESFADGREWEKAATSMLAAWAKADRPWKDRMRYRVFAVAVKGGKGIDAFRASDDKAKDFPDLARRMIGDKKWADLDELIAAHRPESPNDPEYLAMRCRAHVAAKRLEPAAEFLDKAVAAQPNAHVRRLYVSDFVSAAYEQGLGIEAYRLAPKSIDTFDAVALRLLGRKQIDDLDALIREHAKAKPGNPKLPLFRGDVALQRGEFATAEREYRAAMKVSAVDVAYCKNAIEGCRIKAGKAAEVYREGADDPTTFFRVANRCVFEKDAAGLRAVVDSHRKAQPDDPALVRFEIEARSLAKDDAGVMALHAEILASRRKFADKHFLNDRAVRTLVRLKKHDEARRLAEESCKERFADRLPLILAAAATGDAAKTLAAAESRRLTLGALQRYYQDPDLGPLLRQPSLALFRERHPEPPAGEIFYDDDHYDDYD